MMKHLNKVIQGDCLDLIQRLPLNSIDLIITSPPYADIKSYGKKINVLHPDNYNDWLMPLMVDSYRVLKPSGSFIINIGDKCHKKQRHVYALEFPVRVIKETDLKLYDRYFWHKPGIPNGSKKRLNNFTEFIYHFVKDENKLKWNMDNVREEYTQSSLTRIKSKIPQYETKEDGTKILVDRKIHSLNPKGKTPDGMFKFPSNSKMIGNKHPAPFSIDLPEWFIKALTDEGDNVLDPFMGSGTTAIVARRLKRNWIGFELNPVYVDMTNERIGKQNKIYEFFEGE